MKLTPQHREALMEAYKTATEDLDLQKRVLNKHSEDMKEWGEIGVFLAKQKVALITESLIDNQIDF